MAKRIGQLVITISAPEEDEAEIIQAWDESGPEGAATAAITAALEAVGGLDAGIVETIEIACEWGK